MSYIVEYYLAFLQEKEWDDPNDPGSIRPDYLNKVISKLAGIGDLGQLRQAHQPSMMNVYIKRSLGDYRGRADMLNAYRFKKAGIKDWEDTKKLLIKAIDHEKKIHPEKFLNGIKTVQNITKEPLGRELGPDGDSSDGYCDAGLVSSCGMDGGDGGGGD